MLDQPFHSRHVMICLDAIATLCATPGQGTAIGTASTLHPAVVLACTNTFMKHLQDCDPVHVPRIFNSLARMGVCTPPCFFAHRNTAHGMPLVNACPTCDTLPPPPRYASLVNALHTGGAPR